MKCQVPNPSAYKHTRVVTYKNISSLCFNLKNQNNNSAHTLKTKHKILSLDLNQILPRPATLTEIYLTCSWRRTRNTCSYMCVNMWIHSDELQITHILLHALKQPYKHKSSSRGAGLPLLPDPPENGSVGTIV